MDADRMIDIVYRCKCCWVEDSSIDEMRRHVKLMHTTSLITERDVPHSDGDDRQCQVLQNNCELNVFVDNEDAEWEELKGRISKPRLSSRGRRIFPSARISQHSSDLTTKRKQSKAEMVDSMCQNEESKVIHNHLTEGLDRFNGERSDTKFGCARCGKECRSKSGITAHMKSCIAKKKCDQCSQSFKNKEELNVHKQSHCENGMFRCILCEYKSPQWNQVKIHMETHNQPDANKCKECGMAFASSLSLKNHWRFQHLGGKHLCEECGLEATSKYTLFQHEMKCHSAGFLCGHCAFKCDNQIDFKKHVLLRHNSGFICKFCKPTSQHETKDDLLAHMGQKHAGKKCFLCDKCNYVAKLQHHLDKHYLMHTGERPFKCQIENCDFSTRDGRNFKQHMVMRHSKPGALVCRQCQFVTCNQNEWDVHRAMYHMKVLECNKCNYKTGTAACLRRHRLAKHVSHENMRYPCPHCSYRTNFRQSLTKHLLTHNLRNSRHRCVFCRLNFGSREEVKCHLEEMHPKNASKVRYCKVCPYSCKTTQALRQHSLTHSDEKNNKCKHCSYSSRTTTALKAHLLRKHFDVGSPIQGVAQMPVHNGEIYATAQLPSKASSNLYHCQETQNSSVSPGATKFIQPLVFSDKDGLSMLSDAVCAEVAGEKPGFDEASIQVLLNQPGLPTSDVHQPSSSHSNSFHFVNLAAKPSQAFPSISLPRSSINS